MLSLNFKHIFAKIEKALKTIQSNDPSNILILFDNLNMLTNSCYSKNELDFIEIMNEIISYSDRDPSIGVAVGINRDLFDEDGNEIQFYRELKNSVFD